MGCTIHNTHHLHYSYVNYEGTKLIPEVQEVRRIYKKTCSAHPNFAIVRTTSHLSYVLLPYIRLSLTAVHICISCCFQFSVFNFHKSGTLLGRRNARSHIGRSSVCPAAAADWTDTQKKLNPYWLSGCGSVGVRYSLFENCPSLRYCCTAEFRLYKRNGGVNLRPTLALCFQRVP